MAIMRNFQSKLTETLYFRSLFGSILYGGVLHFCEICLQILLNYGDIAAFIGRNIFKMLFNNSERFLYRIDISFMQSFVNAHCYRGMLA